MLTMNKGLSSELSLVTFSLILGLMFWAIVKQQETLNQTILVPVTVANLPEFVELEGFEPSNLAVKFSLRAGDETLARDPGRFRINVDLAVLRNRIAISESFVDYPIDITREMLEFPERLTFSSFDDAPARVIVRARPRIARVPVSPNLRNIDSPAEGYRVDRENIQVDPSEVMVAVDEARELLALQGDLQISTEPVELQGRRDQVSGLYALVLSAERGVFALPGQAAPSVEVIVPIPEIQGRRVFEGVPIRYQALGVGVRAILDPPVATVTIEGPQSIVSGLAAEDILLLPRPVAFLDEETVGEIVDTSIDVRYGPGVGALAEKIRPPVVTPGLVTISFVEVRGTAVEPEESPEAVPEESSEEAPAEEEVPPTEEEVVVDPLPSDPPLEPPVDNSEENFESQESAQESDSEASSGSEPEAREDDEAEPSDETEDAEPDGGEPADGESSELQESN